MPTLPFLARQNKLALQAIWQIAAAMRPGKQIKLQFARRQFFRLSPNDDAGDMEELRHKLVSNEIKMKQAAFLL